MKDLAKICSGLSDNLWNNPKYTDEIMKKFYRARARAVLHGYFNLNSNEQSEFLKIEL